MISVSPSHFLGSGVLHVKSPAFSFRYESKVIRDRKNDDDANVMILVKVIKWVVFHFMLMINIYAGKTESHAWHIESEGWPQFEYHGKINGNEKEDAL